MDTRQKRRWIGLIGIVIVAVVAAGCGGGARASPSASAAAVSPAAPSAATGSEVARTLDGPAEAKAGSEIVVTWAGEVRNGDYVTIVSKRRVVQGG